MVCAALDAPPQMSYNVRMFTGITQGLGILLLATETPSGRRLTCSLAELAHRAVSPGDSISVSGVCLTVAQTANGNVRFDAVAETLRRTTLGGKVSGDRVNLELSLRPVDYVGGHFVQGHIEAVASVVAIQEQPDDWRITFSLPAACRAAVVPKGSVALDGVSMTVAAVAADTFTVAVIPTTLEKTTLGGLQVQDKVNLETDILARSVVHALSIQKEHHAERGSVAPDATSRQQMAAL